MIGANLHNEITDCYSVARDHLATRTYKVDSNDSVKQWRHESKYRALLNSCLPYILSEHKKREEHLKNSLLLIQEQLNLDRNMTEVMGGLRVLINSNRVTDEMRTEYLNHFYDKHSKDPLTIQKWFRLQSTSNHKDILMQMEKLLRHDTYDSNNPNSIY
eukprot:UN29145